MWAIPLQGKGTNLFLTMERSISDKKGATDKCENIALVYGGN
jgi:hypothetical protein